MNYRMRIVHDLADGRSRRLERLARRATPDNPFVRYEFLQALHTTGCASERSGWEPHYLTLWSGKALAAACRCIASTTPTASTCSTGPGPTPTRDTGSSTTRSGWSPVPFTPVPGPRLLALRRGRPRRAGARAAASTPKRPAGHRCTRCSCRTPRRASLAALGQMTRRSVQFHWFNRGFTTFDDYLAALTQPKRKKVRAERRKVAEAGVTCSARPAARSRSRLDVLSPLLSQHVRVASFDAVPEPALLRAHRAHDGRPVAAHRAARRPRIAAALALFDAERLYGRYWGAAESVPCLHFEVSYYQMIEFAIRTLAGSSKAARRANTSSRAASSRSRPGRRTGCAPAFDAAVERYLERESGGIEAYVDELNERTRC